MRSLKNTAYVLKIMERPSTKTNRRTKRSGAARSARLGRDPGEGSDYGKGNERKYKVHERAYGLGHREDVLGYVHFVDEAGVTEDRVQCTPRGLLHESEKQRPGQVVHEEVGDVEPKEPREDDVHDDHHEKRIEDAP